jgi:hypothetical protein
MRILPCFTALCLMATETFAGPLSCYVEGTVGVGVTSTKLDLGSNTGIAGLASSGWLAAPGGGCDIRSDKLLFGAFGRYDLGHETTKFSSGGFGASPRINNPWLVGGRIGTEVNPTTIVYGLLGYGGATMDTTSFGGEKSALRGLTIGGGIEWVVGPGPLSAKMEYDYALYSKVTIGGVDLTPTGHQVRIGFSYMLGTDNASSMK